VSLLDNEYAYVKRYRQIVDVMIRHGFGYLVERFGLFAKGFSDPD
jgi:hypothetical protein